MEKRYLVHYDVTADTAFISDLKTNKKIFIVEARDLLNEQDEKIKEFEQIMEKHNIIGLTKLDACLADYLNVDEDTMSGKIIKQLKQENQQLKQSQNSKAIEALECIAQFMDMYKGNFYPKPLIIRNFIQEQIDEFKEKKCLRLKKTK